MTDTAARKPKILFLHINDSAGQFVFLAEWLAQSGWDVTVAGRGETPETTRNGIRYMQFKTGKLLGPADDYRYPLDYALTNASGAGKLFVKLRDVEGYTPDIVMAHVGWGIGLLVKQVWFDTKYIAFHEWFYGNRDWSKGGRQERPIVLQQMIADRARNMAITAEFDNADAHWCPSHYQASRFPPALRPQLSVWSDGVDCDLHRPDPDAAIDFSWLSLPERPKIVTYTTRGMEPIRGFPQFMKAIALLQKQRDDFHTIILGHDKVYYGARLPDGETWRLRMIDELQLDHRRTHVQAMLPRAEYLKVLQISDAHVYLTEDFVTSWSLSEALAAGCLVIGSNNGPVKELVEDMETGIVVDINDPEEIAEMIGWALDNPAEAAQIRARARAQMQRDHDAKDVFARKDRHLRQMIGWTADD